MTDPTLTDLLVEIRMNRQYSEQKHKEVISQLGKFDDRMNGFEVKLDANTEITSGIRTAMSAGKVFTGVVKWLGAMAIAVGSIWWAIRTALGGDPPSGGFGPHP